MNKQEYAEIFGRWIRDDEMVFDFDSKEWGFHGINSTGINLYNSGYRFEIWYAKGQKSPHLHIKEIHGLEDLEPEQLKAYKKFFMRKYAPKEYLQFLDIQLTGSHRIAQEDKPHYKYGTIKKLLGIWNEGEENFAEEDLLEKAKKKEVEVKINTNALLLKDQIPITAIALKFGLKLKGNMAKCPFHDDTNPSLSLSNEKGVFHCFGCGVKGDLITFYKKLRELKNETTRS